jgi:hypothetical protein
MAPGGIWTKLSGDIRNDDGESNRTPLRNAREASATGWLMLDGGGGKEPPIGWALGA